MTELEILKKAYSLSIEKKPGEGTGSIAYSKHTTYIAGSIASDTNFFAISSEQATLVLSILQKDYSVEKIVTLTNEDSISVSPVILKYLVDYSTRTHAPIDYSIINSEGKVLFETKDASILLPFYKPEKIVLEKIKNAKIEKNTDTLKSTSPLELKSLALKGLERNFPLYDSATAYGTAVLCKSGTVYFAGQYSGVGRMGSLHSEMNAILSALMHGEKDITHIGIVSTKYPDTPCNMCGICRQFISEISAKLNVAPKLYCFTKDTDEYAEHTIEEYLPSVWTSKKW